MEKVVSYFLNCLPGHMTAANLVKNLDDFGVGFYRLIGWDVGNRRTVRQDALHAPIA